jgi:hypothetical protein
VPAPHQPHDAGWFYNYEKELSIKEGLAALSKVIKALTERGEVRLRKETVKLPESARFVIRYEQAPRGELKLKLEIEWEADGAHADHSDGLPEIE